MNDSFFPTQSGAPQMPQIFSQEALNHAGVKTFGFGKDFSDNYINSQMAKYNNDYNYWLWQQQALYNSPAEQVKRLKEAGLNPNYNAIEGAGNLKDTPASKADIHSSAGASGRENMALTLNYVNSILDAVKKGVDTTSQIASLPSNIAFYRKSITQQMRDTTVGKQLDNWLKNLEAVSKGYYELGIDSRGVNVPDFIPYQDSRGVQLPDIYPYFSMSPFENSYATSVFPEESPKFKSIEAQNAYRNVMTGVNSILGELRSGQADINTQQLQNLKEQWRILKEDADFRKWTNSSTIGASIARILGLFL